MDIGIVTLLFLIVLISYTIGKETITTYNTPPHNIIWTNCTNLAQYQSMIDSNTDMFQHSNEFSTNREINDICIYALGGKHLRGITVLEIGRLHNVNLLETALAIEYIHSSSLIIDDMEHFDNDDIRRGKLSVHRKFGPAKAQMAALILLMAAFKNLSRQFSQLKTPAHIISHINYFISNQLQLTSIGQLQDMREAELNELIYNKTGTLFVISTVSAWLLCGNEFNNEILDLGSRLGHFLQVCDDIADRYKQEYNNTAQREGINKCILLLENDYASINKLLKNNNLESNVWYEILYAITRSI